MARAEDDSSSSRANGAAGAAGDGAEARLVGGPGGQCGSEFGSEFGAVLTVQAEQIFR